MSVRAIGAQTAGFSPDLGAELVRLVRSGLGRTKAAGIVGMDERTLLTWQALGRRGHPAYRPWVEAIDEAARSARRDRTRGGTRALGALTRGLAKTVARWRWVVRPRVFELVWRWGGRLARFVPRAHGIPEERFQGAGRASF
jgi:hypothetical protein